MRTSCLVFVFAACSPPPTPPAQPPAPHELVSPARVQASLEVIAYARFDAGAAAEVTELSYALGTDYPADVELVPKGGYAMGPGCALDFGALTWSTLLVEGTAVTASPSSRSER